MSTTLAIHNRDGNEVGALDLDEAWLERTKGVQAVHDAVTAFLAARRAGTASTKTRAEVRGGGAKPYRQKGTGRARAGSIRSPIWRGGGVVFGPTPRSYAKQVNRKVRRLALRRAFSERVDEGAVILLENIAVDEPKTRNVVAILDAVGATNHDALIIVDELQADLCIAARNLPGVRVSRPESVNAYWMLLFEKIIITRAGLEALGTLLGRQEKGGSAT